MDLLLFRVTLFEVFGTEPNDLLVAIRDGVAVVLTRLLVVTHLHHD